MLHSQKALQNTEIYKTYINGGSTLDLREVKIILQMIS